MNKLIFFTVNDFSKDDGGTLRMRGVLNGLANNNKIILISNSKTTEIFNSNIEHIYLDYKFTKEQKKIFQLFLVLFPVHLLKLIFSNFYKRINQVLLKLDKKEIIFFEHLDNSIGVSLKKLNIINKLSNDTHGIATLEFENKKDTKIVKRLYNKFVYLISYLLETQTYKSTDTLIVVSQAMEDYLKEKYKILKSKEIIIIRDGVNKEISLQHIDNNMIKDLKIKYPHINNKKIILFIGSFKDLGGVEDLVLSFINVNKIDKNIILFLIGDGEKLPNIKKIIIENDLSDNIILHGRINYNQVKTYQSLSDVIVCPDKSHPYSDIVPHVKYFDSLSSGKPVINGSFKSTLELNKNENLSIDFEPSNINDLTKKILYCLNNIEELNKRYSDNSKLIVEKMSYEFYTKNIRKL